MPSAPPTSQLIASTDCHPSCVCPGSGGPQGIARFPDCSNFVFFPCHCYQRLLLFNTCPPRCNIIAQGFCTTQTLVLRFPNTAQVIPHSMISALTVKEPKRSDSTQDPGGHRLQCPYIRPSLRNPLSQQIFSWGTGLLNSSRTYT